MMSLMKMDWDQIEKLIEVLLNEHLRTWGSYDYLIVNDATVLIKVYDEDTQKLMFTIKAQLISDKLEITDAW
jgi:hypothetical protein